MFRTLRSLGLTRPCLPAVLVLCLAPAVVSAEALRFKNETPGIIVLQTACITRAGVHVGPRFILNPGDMTPAIMLPGNKVITVYDNPRNPNPNRILFQGTIPAGMDDLSFGIVPDANQPPRLKLDGPRRGTQR